MRVRTAATSPFFFALDIGTKWYHTRCHTVPVGTGLPGRRMKAMAAQSNSPVVSLTGVFKTYKVGEVDVPAVKGVTFSIPRRRFSVIVGPSGSGKTTLLNLIGCLDKATTGQ